MKSKNQVIDPDVVLIGSGIMSATLGAMLKELNPALSIQLYEMTEEFGKEASNGWHNAGTGHAGPLRTQLHS
jgi:malate dehydrogenase (quinone)